MGIPKLPHPDLNQVNVLEWMLAKPEKFFDYGVHDCISPVESIISLMECKNQLALELSYLKILPSKYLQKFLNQTFLTTASSSDNIISSVIEQLGLKMKYQDF